MSVPQEFRYTETHEWVKVEEGNIVTVGITDYAQEQIGDIVSVELPSEGTEVQKGEAFCQVDSQKTSEEVFAPVSGVIAEVNTLVDEDPSLLNTDPYDEGWLIRVEMENPDELEELMTADEYEEYLGTLQEEE